jgi:disulfide bond formation protein DsbB
MVFHNLIYEARTAITILVSAIAAFVGAGIGLVVTLDKEIHIQDHQSLMGNKINRC